MSVHTAHGISLEQLNQYDSIYSIDDFSVAEYKKNESNNIVAFSHSHEEYEFIIPLKTIPLLIYEKANYIGEVGYIYPVNPMTNHGLEFPLNDASCIDITVSQKFLDKTKEEFGYTGKYFYTRFQYSSSFIDLIRKYQDEFVKKANPETLKLLRKLIVNGLVETGLAINIDNRRPEKQYRKSIRNIIIYMFDHFKDPSLSIEKLAEMSGFSPAYFTKSFKAYMSDTPIMHLNKLRISEAKFIMNNEPDVKFSEICERVGYANVSTFTEAFKTVTGDTPSNYRKKYIK